MALYIGHTTKPTLHEQINLYLRKHNIKNIILTAKIELYENI